MNRTATGAHLKAHLIAHPRLHLLPAKTSLFLGNRVHGRSNRAPFASRPASQRTHSLGHQHLSVVRYVKTRPSSVLLLNLFHFLQYG